MTEKSRKFTLFEKHDGQIRTASAHDDEHSKNSDKHASAQHLRTCHQLQHTSQTNTLATVKSLITHI